MVSFEQIWLPVIALLVSSLLPSCSTRWEKRGRKQATVVTRCPSELNSTTCELDISNLHVESLLNKIVFVHSPYPSVATSSMGSSGASGGPL